MTYEECMLEILSNPEADSPRLKLAEIVRASDPIWAEFIERQLEMTRRMRTTKYRPGVARVGHITHEENVLINEHGRRWSENLSFFMGETVKQRNVEFHRGLPWLCSMNPYLFLEQGEYVISRIAPLRGIEFFPDPEGDPFPAAEIAASPLLAHLDQIRFQQGTLREGDLEILAGSPHLKRLLVLDVRKNELTSEAWERLAANESTRRCLSVDNSYEVASDGGPIGECGARFDVYPNRYFEMSAEGRALETKYGYLPWLHFANVAHPADAHYWVNERVLPRFVPGSPAAAPTAYGDGLGSERVLEPRSNFDERAFDSVWS